MLELIQSLEPEPYDLLMPIDAVIRRSGDGFVASFFDANVNASGETETEAFENLKDILVGTYEELSALGADRLGQASARRLRVLQGFLRRRGR